MAYFSDPDPPHPRPSIHLRRYLRYYQFGERYAPRTDTPGSAKEWHFFRICHSIRVRWENEQQEKRTEERENARESSGGTGPHKRATETASRASRVSQKGLEQFPNTEGGQRARSERERIKDAQKRLGVEEYNKEENRTPGKRRPKNFKGSRVKVHGSKRGGKK